LRFLGQGTQEFPMTINWLTTSAIALVIGTGAVIAQTQPDAQMRDESPRAQSAPSKDADRPAAGDQRPSDRMKGRAEQSEPKEGVKDQQRGEAASPAERKQAQEPQGRDTKEPSRQSQDQPGRGGERPAGTRQSQDEQKGRDAKQATDSKQQQGRDEQRKQDNRAADGKKPADAKQQQGQREQDRERKDQAAQPSETSTQQSARPGETHQDQRQQQTGQTPDQAAGRSGSSQVTVNDDQRRQIVDRLRNERTSTKNININLDIGERLPPRVRPRPLPPEIVRIAPQYRDYEYTVIEDRIAIVDPRTREVVDVINERGSGGRASSRVERERVVISGEQRDRLKQAVRTTTTMGSSSPSSSLSDSSCLTLQPVPEDLVRSNPELSSYRYLAIGDQVVLVDPGQKKIVQVID
jgi:hypothetical protein